MAAYALRCCVTREATVEILDAAHIQPYVNKESDHVQNGLALRADFHRLFDAGLITLDSEYRVVLSERLTSEVYAAYQGQRILMPQVPFHNPSKEALWVHRNLVFRT